MAKISDTQVQTLEAEIKALKEQLGEQTKKLTDAEKASHSLSGGAMLAGNIDEGFPTGKTVTVTKCKNPWVKDAKKQEFIEVELPTFMYTINLPAGAGDNLSTNGIMYYHGQTYEFDSEVLAEMKYRVAQCWYHEKSIHGENENAYRKKSNVHYRAS